MSSEAVLLRMVRIKYLGLQQDQYNRNDKNMAYRVAITKALALDL